MDKNEKLYTQSIGTLSSRETRRESHPILFMELLTSSLLYITYQNY
jgi:hypothetical protein